MKLNKTLDNLVKSWYHLFAVKPNTELNEFKESIMDENESKVLKRLATGATFTVIGVIALGMWGCPQYDVYQQGLSGKASLARAEQDRQIAIKEAQAKKESAKMLAEAEVIRAGGVAKANKIIAKGLGGAQGYLRYLWIQALSENDSDVIYIPTEAGLPILEAKRLDYLDRKKTEK